MELFHLKKRKTMAREFNKKKKNLTDYHLLIAILILIGGIALLILEFTKNDQLRIYLQVLLVIELLFMIIFGHIIKRKNDIITKKELNLLKVFMKFTPDVVYFKDLDSKFIKISKAFKDKSLDLSLEDVVGKTDFDLFDSKHAEKAFKDEQEIIQTNISKLNILEEEIHKDGTISWVLSSKFPLLDSHDNVIGTFGISRDITTEKIAIEKLEQAREKEREWIFELEKRSKDNIYLNEMNDTLQTIDSMKEAYVTIIEFASKIFKDEVGGLFILDKHTNMLNLVSSWGKICEITKSHFPSSDCIALENGITNLYDKQNHQEICNHIDSLNSQKNMCIPIVAPGETFGILFIQPKQSLNNNWPETYKNQFIKNFTFSAGLALANIQLRENLREQSIRDPLTNLFNRRYMVETLERECSRISRKKATLGLIMIDIDYFKRINDTFGHDAGDYVLQTVSQIFSNMIRAEDIACRYGGEEFILILPEVDQSTLQKRAEQIRKTIEETKFKFNQKDLKKITISAGLNLYTDYSENVDQIIEKADKALYQAKRNGRNQIKIA